MEVVLLPSPEDCARVVADAVAGSVAAARADGPVALGLATGSSPLLAYRELLARHRAGTFPTEGVTGYLLDEYVGLPAGHPESYREVIRREITDELGITAHGPDGSAADPLRAALDYEARLRAAGPVAVQVLGIGANGHVGFNEPGSSLVSRTRVKTLTERTRTDNARFFGGDVEAVPRHVITQGLGTIRDAQHLVLVATGGAKAAAVAEAVEGPLSASCPGSVLQLHPHVTVVVDEAAGSRLTRASYYRYVLAHKLAEQGW
ncbi:glucosamine-6-phosphate deaminase [Klenkia brasiliensis]|uniref:Glucosamine-6-phosphate deaminase n=1 Tax=Klenkia brasiliensis TaxID=333142 RepID=A0A1G7XZ17_9ACTN|nr:glucosamine-6-phosphate deaminase [Klenkia brasiliensis]SDG88960.1 glucosamine-6-phosphate deaminase [Klenkia brasiliensis]